MKTDFELLSFIDAKHTWCSSWQIAIIALKDFYYFLERKKDSRINERIEKDKEF